jgi:Zn-dependent peptidase ImmA (M78 family)
MAKLYALCQGGDMVRPEAAAAQLLERYPHLNIAPIDPVRIAQELGLDVLVAELPEDVSGALIKEQGRDPVIFLNASDHKNRKRFTCAHEIGHYIFRMSNGQDKYEYVDFRSSLSKNGTDSEEIFANQFAANLLMPESLIRKFENEYPAFMLSSIFDVSDDAINYRLKNLSKKVA